MGQKTKAAIGSNAILIGNSPAWSTYQSRDITMIESRNAPNSSAFNTFLKDSDTAAGWGQATLDTIYWLWDGSTGYMSTYASILDFSLPACLLTDDIFGIPNNTTIYGIMEKVGKIGYPKAARYRANGILQRDFTAGKVLFNDTSASVTVSLPTGVYKNVDGNAVNSVTLQSYRGIVLKGSGTTATVPTAPTNLALTSVTKGVTSGNYYVNLTWKDNATNETGYEIQQATTSAGPFTVIKTPAVNAQGYSVNIGSTPGTYYYQVKAVNTTGKSEPSNTIEAKVGTVAPTVPSAPTNLTASLTKGTTGNSIVTLKWTDSSSNETGFDVSQTIGTGTAQVIKSVAANTTTYSVDLGTNPAAGTYNYTVTATNTTGKSAASNIGNVTVAAAPTVPATPTNLALTSVTTGVTSGNYYVNMTWKDNSTNETGYEIQQATSSSGPFTVVKTPAANAAGYSVNIGSTPGTYYYQVVAVNATGKSAVSNVIEAKVGTTATVPATPSNLTLVSVTKGITSGSYYINLTWKDNATNETGYEILESVNSTGSFQILKTPAANAGNYSVNIGASPIKGTHYYEVKAVNATGKSNPSNIVSTIIK